MAGKLPQGAVLLANEDQGRVFRVGDALVIESTFGGKRVETRLPADLEWLWNWHEMLEAACDRLATLNE